ncbi:MAG: HAD family hydrolase [Akkermansiaceae bacterium]|jgi:phosphoglycolate phosphatase|nr:HAD-IA family hydrolase [Luteolibacter sp.]
MRALIFDLDGTLVESLPGIAASLNRALIQHGLPGQSHANVRGFIGDGAIKLVQRALATVSRIDITESVLNHFAADYAVSWPRGTSVYLGMLGLLQQLEEQAIPLAVLSNKPHPFTAEIVVKLFPNTHFTVVLGNRDGLPHKPDPTGALQIAHTLGVAPEDCIIIGDSIMDLETAKNANMKSIAVTWGYHDRERLVMADVIVDTMDQLDLAIQSLIS